MRYKEMPGRVFKRKEDYVNSIVRACARKFFWQMYFLDIASQNPHCGVKQFFGRANFSDYCAHLCLY